MFDLIGDIHGHSDDLVQLLELLGYRSSNDVYRHPERRRVIFLGDFIDRGPQIRRVLQIVRPMVEAEAALAVMGNHEFNALAFHTAHLTQTHAHLRIRNIKNIRQHGQTILQLKDEEMAHALGWFRTLPMSLDLPEGLRAVHACWDDRAVAVIEAAKAKHHGYTDAFMHAACDEKDPLFQAVEIVLKGKEAALPDGQSFLDKDGHERTKVRSKWYLPPQGHTYGSFALQSDPIDCETDLAAAVIEQFIPYPSDAKPVFMGHYWLKGDRPAILADNVACVDYSVAKEGFLCAYRWHGEQKLSNDNFVWIPNAI